MAQICLIKWPKEPLRPRVFWPGFGSFEDWVSQALNRYVNSEEPLNQEESDDAALWVGASNAFPPEQILALNTRSDRGKEEWEPLDNMPPPSSWQPEPPQFESRLPTAPVLYPSPPAQRTRSNMRATEREESETGGWTDDLGGLYPLREVALGGNQGGIGFVVVPLNTSDVRNFKKELGNLLDEPLGVAESLEQFLGPNRYTWEEMQSILGILFAREERGMIRQAGMRLWERQNQGGPPGDVKWPNSNPNWDHQAAQGRQNMRDLRAIVIQGIKESVPRGQNINKAFNECQCGGESPTEWLDRLRKSLQMYSGIDPDSPAGGALLRTQFVANSWEDMRKKWEKLDDWHEKGLEEFLREAQKV
uniref:Core shell protein Gag P30 domain-containing protein n=1 Tax=Cairina moschata TaxID=8855 RepID=A0A8C3D2S5_CAIMO